MIKTQIIEVKLGPNMEETQTELGWCLLPEVPVEKKPPEMPEEGRPFPKPLTIRINGSDYFIIGHSWDIGLKPFKEHAEPARMILVVQRVPEPPAIEAPNHTLDVLRQTMPAGASKN